MIDFKAMLEQQLARMTPEERARHDEYWAREARFDETRTTIEAHFAREEMRPQPTLGMLGRLQGGRRSGTGNPKAPMKRVTVKEWTRSIPMRIEERENNDGTIREIISFKEAVTGHESYHLDEDFVRRLTDPKELAERPRWYICAGTPGRWDACWVDPADVEAYLRERRPALFENAAALPTP